MHSKSLSLFASWHDCRSGGPDVWYITRTWLIIGDGLHQGGVVAYVHGGWINDSNHVRRHQAALYDDVSEWVGEVTLLDQGWHHCERAKVAIWGPPSHIWAACYHQINYGAKHEVRLYFGGLADFQGTGKGPGRSPALPIISRKQKLFL